MPHPYFYIATAERLPTDRVFEEFIDLTKYYPESLVGASAAMGAAGLELEGLGIFAAARLDNTGGRLNHAAAHVIEIHNDEIDRRGSPRLRTIREDRLTGLLPLVAHLGISSVISAVGELAKARAGKPLDEIRPVNIGDRVFSSAQNFLSHADNFDAVRALLQAATTALRAPEGPIHTLSEDYKAALFRQPRAGSRTFPPTEGGKHHEEPLRTTQDKKERLAACIRPLLRAELRNTARQHRLNPHELTVFTHNITRP